MRLLAAILATGLSTGVAQAGKLHCSFTEPFFTIDYDSSTGKVIFIAAHEFDENGKPIPQTIAESAKLVAEPNWQDYPTFYLKNGGQTILKLIASGRGSDGMSESLFPFDGWHGGWQGGCETEKIQSWELYDFHEDFGIPF